ncbi:hypothetical protein [Paenibacillus lutrae]|uniref:Uncharacterized protein n=1 Tax=Paenibacillus lutrae TaxID=2078573 RepID=A0A7X3FEE0_9BACL|nr:hypothetical protein [Paenibacillus lutrae]MVO98075.1 hypothetical protein [Paenibacillus lutrae]
MKLIGTILACFPLVYVLIWFEIYGYAIGAAIVIGTLFRICYMLHQIRRTLGTMNRHELKQYNQALVNRALMEK